MIIVVKLDYDNELCLNFERQYLVIVTRVYCYDFYLIFYLYSFLNFSFFSAAFVGKLSRGNSRPTGTKFCSYTVFIEMKRLEFHLTQMHRDASDGDRHTSRLAATERMDTFYKCGFVSVFTVNTEWK
jgi:hypothetical protein